LIQNAIALARIRSREDKKQVDGGNKDKSESESSNQLHELVNGEQFDCPLPKNKNNMYGHCPRFVRMRLMHQLLFYMTWDYTGQVDIVRATLKI
jgi:hypothetical protein